MKMSKLESVKRVVRRWLISIPFLVILGLILGGLISVPLVPKPYIATINLSGFINDQTFIDNILDSYTLFKG